jgi:hypothetical protein
VRLCCSPTVIVGKVGKTFQKKLSQRRRKFLAVSSWLLATSEKQTRPPRLTPCRIAHQNHIATEIPGIRVWVTSKARSQEPEASSYPSHRQAT